MQIWTIKNEASQETAEIMLYGPIIDNEGWFSSGVGAKELAESLQKLNNKPLNLRINSYGGSVFAGHAMMSALKAYGGKVTAYIDGIAASAAVLPLLGADKVVMPTNSMLMIHNPLYSIDGSFDQHDMKKMSETLVDIKKSIVAAYKTKTHLSVEKLSQMMDSETWLTAQEAYEFGFADEVKGLVNVDLQGNNIVSNGLSLALNELPASGKFINLINNKNKPLKDGETPMNENTQILNRIEKMVSNFFNSKKVEQPVNLELNVPTGIELTSENLKNEYPDIFDSIFNEGYKKGVVDERTRIQEIDNIAKSLPEAYINKAKYDEIQNAKDVALMYIEKGGAALHNMKTDVEISNANDITASGESEFDESPKEEMLINLIVEGGKK